MEVKLLPEAEAELTEAAQWYENRNPGLGGRFLPETTSAFSDIGRIPRRCALVRYRTVREIRRRILSHFPYAIIYEVRDSECIVVAVAHGRRRPVYWRSRLA